MRKHRVESASAQYNGTLRVMVYDDETVDRVAEFAMLLIEKHANVAAIQSGEDSAGRSQLRLQSPEELVERSFHIAELTWQMARDRGHLISLPDLNEVNREHDERAADIARLERERLEARKLAVNS